MAIEPSLRAGVGYAPLKDFVHVVHLADAPLVLLAVPALPVSSARELIAYSKANPGKVNTASTGNGTYTHLTLELFKAATGADLTHVAYKGAAPAFTDMLGGQVQTMFTTTASAQPYTSTSRLKALAVTARKRSPLLPSTPTFAEQGVPQLDVSVWIGIAAPAGTPSAAVFERRRRYSPPVSSGGSRNSFRMADSENPRLCRKRTWRAFSRWSAGALPKRRRHSAIIPLSSSIAPPAIASAIASSSTPRALSAAPIARLL